MKSTIRLLLIWCMFSSLDVLCQADVIGHNGTAGQYLGWNTLTTIPLEIRHNRNDQPIGMFTNNLQRLRINAGNANPTINGV
jgi:hypothetical protein